MIKHMDSSEFEREKWFSNGSRSTRKNNNTWWLRYSQGSQEVEPP
jgi:hypothetical protein